MSAQDKIYSADALLREGHGMLMELTAERDDLRRRLDALMEAAETSMRSLDEHDYAGLRSAIDAAKGGE